MATKLKLETRLKVGPVLGSYANLFTPRAVDQTKEPRYSISMLFDKKANPNSPEAKSFATLKTLLERVAVLKFGPDWKLIPNFQFPIRDGDVEKPELPEYAGKTFVNASSTRKPGLLDRQLKPVMSESEAYSGCLFICSVNIFGYSNVKKGVGVGLNNLLVFEKGKRIDGRKDAIEDFAEYAGEDAGAAPAENPLD